MSRCGLRIALGLFAGLVGLQAYGFVPIKNTSGSVIKWTTVPVSYFRNDRGTVDIPGSQEQTAINASFASWNAITDTVLRFTDSGLASASPSTVADAKNAIGWIEDPSNPLTAAVDIQAASLTFCSPGNVSCDNGTAFSEVDIYLNGVSWSWTNQATGNYSTRRGPLDVQAILTHEIGHFAGLEHVTTRGNVMYFPVYSGSISWRTLSQDEISFARAIYPLAAPPPETAISGTVRRGGTAVPGAYVVAVQGGRVIVGAIASGTGAYALRWVPPGSYFIRVQPYTRNPGITESAFYQNAANVDVDFLSAFYPNTATTEPPSPPGAQVVSVIAGQTLPGIDFSVSATANANDPFEEDDTSATARTVGVAGNAELHHSWDPTAGVPDQDWVKFPATQNRIYLIETQNPGRAVTSTSEDSATFLQLYASSGGALLASNISRNLVESDPTSRIAYREATAGTTTRFVLARQRSATARGAGIYFDLLVTELTGPFPVPSVTSVTPAQGSQDGGMVVTVRGSGFIPGTEITFGGVAGTDEDVQECVSPGNCQAVKVTVPAHAPGLVTVQVTNLDGGSGSLANGFEYLTRQVGTFIDDTFAAYGQYDGDGQAVCWGDFDNDGDQDLFRATGTSSARRLLRNNGDGTFTDITAAAGISTGGLVSCAWGDYDGDGDLDLYLAVGCNPGTNFLYRNNGNSTFTDVTAAAGVGGDSAHCSLDAAWSDYDNDGDLDLYVVYTELNDPSPRANQLFRNTGGVFSDVAVSTGTNLVSASRRALWADYDNDGFPDLLVVNVSSRSDVLYHNNRNGTFSNVTAAAGIVESANCYDEVWADLNNDGFLDIFCAGDSFTPSSTPQRVWINQKNGTFVDLAAASGINSLNRHAHSVTVLDKDNDGDIDLYMGCSFLTGQSTSDLDALLENDGANPPHFTNVAAASGVDESAFPREGEGVASADFDNDNFTDVLVTGSGSTFIDDDYFWKNTSNVNQSLTVRLLGSVTNKWGLGASVTVIPDYPGTDTPTEAQCLNPAMGTTKYRQEVLGGSHNQNSIELEFGLGTRPIGSRQVDCVNVSWPRSGLQRGFTQVATNQRLEIAESYPTLHVTRISPSVGSTAGGTSVTIYGFNFSNAVPTYPRVLLGGVAASSVVLVSANVITCTTPAHVSGSVDVRVENSGTSSDTLAGAYTYVGPGQDINLTVTKGAGNVILNWTDAAQGVYYRVKRALGPRPSDFSPAPVCVVQATRTYTDTGAANNTTKYFYLVDTTLTCP